MIPIAKLGTTGDPQWSFVMPGQSAIVINQATPVPGEEATRFDGVKIPPRVNPIPKRHSVLVYSSYPGCPIRALALWSTGITGMCGIEPRRPFMMVNMVAAGTSEIVAPLAPS